MPLENTRYAFNTYVIHVTIKGSSCQCLVDGICQVILKRYLLNYYITPLNYISHESSVLLSICLYFCLFLSSLDCASLSQNSVMDYTTKGMTPSPSNDFLCYFRSCNLFSFHNAVNNTRLLHTSLTNSHITKNKIK